MGVFQLNEQHKDALSANWGWFFVWGLALIILGTFAITYASVTTVVSVVMLGIVLTIFGGVAILDSFQFWWRVWGSFFFHLIQGILYLVAGIMLIKGPIVGSISLTLFFAILFVAVGVIRMINSLVFHLPGRWWRFFNGLLSLVLGILILKQWPMSGLFIIGLFIGIDLLIAGWVYIMAAFSARSLTKAS